MTLKELQEKRGTLAKAATDHADACDTRAKAEKRSGWTAEENETFKKLWGDYDNFKTSELDPAVAAQKKADDERNAVTAQLDQLDGYEDYQPTRRNPRLGRDGGSLEDGTNIANTSARGLQMQSLALRTWMNRGTMPEGTTEAEKNYVDSFLAKNVDGNELHISMGGTKHFRDVQRPFKVGSRTRGEPVDGTDLAFRNDMVTGTLTTGGSLIGETLLGRLEIALLSYIGILQFAEVIVTDSGEPMRWPTMDDTGNTGSRVGENQDATASLTSTDPVTGRQTWNAYTFTSGGLNCSRSFLNDNGVGFENLIGGMLGTRIGRKHNADFTNGADVGNGPLGLMQSTTLGKTAASATALAPDEIIDLIHSVDPAYRSAVGETIGFSFHDAILQVLRKLKDGTGRYLWSMGTDAAEPDRLHGQRYFINQAMDSTIASGKKTMVYGALSKYKVRFVNGLRIQRLIERRAEFDEDVFIAYMRGDGGLLDAGQHPVKHLIH